MLQLIQQIVWEIPRRLVHFIDQYHRTRLGRMAILRQQQPIAGQGIQGGENRFAKGLIRQVIERGAALIPALDILKPFQGVIGVKQISGFTGRLGLKAMAIQVQLPGQGFSKLRFARAGLSREQQGLAKHQGNVAGILQARIGDVGLGLEKLSAALGENQGRGLSAAGSSTAVVGEGHGHPALGLLLRTLKSSFTKSSMGIVSFVVLVSQLR